MNAVTSILKALTSRAVGSASSVMVAVGSLINWGTGIWAMLVYYAYDDTRVGQGVDLASDSKRVGGSLNTQFLSVPMQWDDVTVDDRDKRGIVQLYSKVLEVKNVVQGFGKVIQ